MTIPKQCGVSKMAMDHLKTIEGHKEMDIATCEIIRKAFKAGYNTKIKDDDIEIEEIYFNGYEGEYGAIICCFDGGTPSYEKIKNTIKRIKKVV